MCAGVEGRVLDLTGTARATDFQRADEVVRGLDAASDSPGSFDVAVSVLWLSGVADTTGVLAELAVALKPEGELLFLDAVREPGIGRHGQGLVSPLLQRTAGWRVDRDIPALLRDAGWTITDLERIPMARYLWPLHGMVEGLAHARVGRAT